MKKRVRERDVEEVESKVENDSKRECMREREREKRNILSEKIKRPLLLIGTKWLTKQCRL